MFSALQKLLSIETPGNKVLEIKNESLGSSQVLLRDDAMVLYSPPFQQGDKKSCFEIVLQRSCIDSNTSSFSLFRGPNQKEAEEKFNAFHSRVPIFVSIVKEFSTVNGLQKICDSLSEHPSWTIAHLVAYYNLVEYVSNPKFLELMDDPDYQKYMTPFQVAVKNGNFDMVKTLLPICKIDHLDNDGNSVFHYAAGTTKEIINLIASKSTANLNHCNVDGYTPLHLACLADKPECVKALLFAGADVNLEAKNISQKTYKSSAPSSAAEFLKTNANKLYIQDMKYGGTPLHWCSSRETLQALIERGCDVNAKNFDGRTALHVMVARNRFECVVSLLAHDADIDILDKDGNTALHLAIEKKLVNIVQCLVVFGCDFNLPNRDGKTPRHMVGKEASGGKDDEILYILHSVGARRCPPENTRCPTGCNHNESYNGIPPEPPEAMEQREHIQQMLATTARNFVRNGTNNINLPSTSSSTEFSQLGEMFNGLKNVYSNSKGASSNPPLSKVLQASPVDTEPEQKGHNIMDSILQMFTTSKPKAVDATKKESDSPEESNTQLLQGNDCKGEKPYGKGRLLCLDGGGIRGLVLVQMLLEIERLTQTPIIHLFDWIAGTSTGGILALGLGCGKTLRQCMGLYLRMKENCFVGSRPYPSELFENVLKSELGEFTTMTDIKHPKLMVTGVMADRKPVDLHLFRNYKTASDILNFVTPITNRRIPPPPPEEQLVWRAARATGAAPSYFRAFGRFLDGGLIANNPTLDAMTEIHEYNMALKSVGRDQEAIPISCVVSLGTGLIPVTEMKEIDVFRPESIWDTAKLAYGISAIGNLLVDQATASDGRVVDRARAWCSTMGVPYYRFNPQLSEDIAMDEKSDEKLINMLWHAKAYVHANRNRIMEMIGLLK